LTLDKLIPQGRFMNLGVTIKANMKREGSPAWQAPSDGDPARLGRLIEEELPRFGRFLRCPGARHQP
jgi:hypothetical protein